MGITVGFRLSTYVTLMLACLCLALAEQPYVPGTAWFAGPVLALLVVAFFVDGRCALPVWTANVLGVFIVFGSAMWLISQLLGPAGSFARMVPWPVAILPHLGPVLMILLLVKLFRPKQPSDYWLLHGMGLFQASLACVLGGSPLFGLLLCLYAAVALWSLALFYLQRRHAQATAFTPDAVDPLRPSPLIPWRSLGLVPAARWLVAVMLFALVLTLFTPRFAESEWSAYDIVSHRRQPRAQTGAGVAIDLNRTGRVEVNDEAVIEVYAESAAGRPKLNLPADQHWRGIVLDVYQSGRWLPGQRMTMTGGMFPMPNMGSRRGQPPLGQPSRPPKLQKGGRARDFPDPIAMMQPANPPRGPAARLPDLGPDQYVLTFKLRPRQAGGLFLADPVLIFPKDTALPIVVIEANDGGQPLFIDFNGTVGTQSMPPGQCQYRQVTRSLKEHDLGPPVEPSISYIALLSAAPPDAVRSWTDELLARLAAERGSGVSPEDVADVGGNRRPMLRPGSGERVARALCDHLKNSGEYTYTLDLRRKDRDLDPADDFLRNVKQGNCDRYAGALALMLRAEGIPARVVKGFRGADGRGDGHYDIHNSQAHSWVEALVARPGPDGQQQLHWLALDPTPDGDAPPPTFSLDNWWDSSQRLGQELWMAFVVDYDTDEQAALLDKVATFCTPTDMEWTLPGLFTEGQRIGLWVVLGLAVVLPAAFWRWRRRRPRAQARPAQLRSYARLLTLLARHARLRPEPAQTPREFGEVAGRFLSTRAAASFADLPEKVVALFYRIRFGGHTPSDDECRTIDLRLEQLAATLATR